MIERIGIISDIHGNMPALEAVLHDIKQRGLSRIICLGDLAGKGPCSVKAVDRIRETCHDVIQGNWDYLLSIDQTHPRFTWHQQKLGEERVAYLRHLPRYMEFYMSGRLIRLCHASPHDLFHRVYLTSNMADRLVLFNETETLNQVSDVVGYGDIHGAHVDCFDGKMLFNVGSVGNPLELAQASYAIMEGEWGCRDEDRPFALTLVRVPYDIKRAIEDAEAEIGLPDRDEYIKELITAKYRGRND